MVEILSWDEVSEAECDEMWSFVQTKKNQRWLWYAIDHNTRAILAFVFEKRKDSAFKKLKKFLKPFGIITYYTDNWSSYSKNISPENHIIGKENTQRIERKNLTLRTRIKRLHRKTICYSKSQIMHDLVIGLVINILEFKLDVKRLFRCFRT